MSIQFQHYTCFVNLCRSHALCDLLKSRNKCIDTVLRYIFILSVFLHDKSYFGVEICVYDTFKKSTDTVFLIFVSFYIKYSNWYLWMALECVNSICKLRFPFSRAIGINIKIFATATLQDKHGLCFQTHVQPPLQTLLKLLFIVIFDKI